MQYEIKQYKTMSKFLKLNNVTSLETQDFNEADITQSKLQYP